MAIPCGVVITETLPISIFLAVSTVNKVSYKLYRRGLFERQSTVFWWTSKFRSLWEFVEALRKQFGDMSRGI